MSKSRMVIIVIAIFLSLVSEASAAPGTPTAVQAFLDARPGAVGLYDGARLTALYGVPLATEADPAVSTDTFVAN